MAGAGYKLFNTGDVLTAAQVNTYLQEQTVMVFADATARTTALAGVLAEGMVTYLKDTDALEIYSGTAWVGYGSGDITGVTAGTGLSGGGTSGAVTVSLTTPVTATNGGTAQTTYSTGDLLYASATNTLSKLPIGSAGTVLTVNAGVPSWQTAAGDITGVTAGTGISGGGTSGTVTITNSMATEITAAGDIIVGTGSGTFDNLPIGTTGQILTADTSVSPYKVKWAAAASSGGMTLITDTAVTAVTEINFTSISSSYKGLVLSCENIAQTTDNENFHVRFNGITANDSYFYTRIINNPGATPTLQGMNGGGSASAITFGGFDNFDTTNSASIYLEFPFYTSAGYRLFSGWAGGQYGSSTNPASWSVEGVAKTTSAISSIKVYVISGTFKAQGNIKLYGVS